MAHLLHLPLLHLSSPQQEKWIQSAKSLSTIFIFGCRSQKRDILSSSILNQDQAIFFTPTFSNYLHQGSTWSLLQECICRYKRYRFGMSLDQDQRWLNILLYKLFWISIFLLNIVYLYILTLLTNFYLENIFMVKRYLIQFKALRGILKVLIKSALKVKLNLMPL